MRYFIFLAVLLFSASASADIEAQFFTGDGGDAEYDGVDVQVGDDRGKSKGEKSDVDSAVSFALAFTFPSGSETQFGPRIGWFYFEPEINDDDSPEMEINIVDAGLWMRRSLKLSEKLGGFFGLGGGASYARLETDADDLPELTGYGYHVVVGAGLETRLESTKISAGVYYTHHAFDELEGKEDRVEITMKDTTVSQVMLGASIHF